MITRWCHEKVAHSGRDITLNYICEILYFEVCHIQTFQRKLPAASLPSDRLCEKPPFTYCDVDLFGPFVNKEGHKELKRYGGLFACLSSKAIHIETVASLNTDSFILCLRRFIGRKRNIRRLRSDNGSNIVGASSEFKKAFGEMDQQKINDFMRDNGVEWMLWKQNPPSASNMGRVWEKKIRSARTILTSFLKTHGTSLNDE